MLTSNDKPIPIVQEEVVVHRHTEDRGGVRVRVESATHTETFDAPVVERRVEIERVPRNTVVSNAEAPWQDGDVLIVPIYREVMVKQLILVEEVRIIPVTEVRHQTVSVELRNESPVVERRDGDGGDWQEVHPDAST